MSLVAEEREFACFNGESAMEVDDTEEGEEDPFLAFVEYARSVLSPDDEDGGGDGGRDLDSEAEVSRPGWSWIAARILKTCIAYSSGVTAGILLSELSQAWSEQHRFGAPKKRPEIVNQLKKKHRRSKLPNTVTIDSVHEKNFITLSSVLEAVIVDIFVLPGTNIYMLTLGDFWSSNTIDLFMHRRYYDLVDPSNEILKKGREIFLTGCYLRTAREGSGYPRLLPTEYLVIILDDDQDDDAMLIAARFCSDSFSSVSLQQAQNGISYSLYARIESIGPLEAKGSFCNVQRKQVTLVDNEDKRLKFLLWGEQVLLANLLSVGSMIALDQPFITSSNDIAVETDSEICLEYGSATQLYLVPFVQHEEQVYISSSSSQIRHQGSRLSLTALTPTPRVSQVSLPCDSLGSIDFSSYPFRSFITDLTDKMTGFSLYGIVTDIHCERSATKVIFYLGIEDTSGSILAKLHFVSSWSLGRLSPGHSVFISGLSSNTSKKNRLEVSWFENQPGSSFINLSCLPALLNSSCLHKLSRLSDLSTEASCTYICRVRLDQVSQCHVNTDFAHSSCGRPAKLTPSGNLECSFCQCSCDSEVVRTLFLKIPVADETAKIFGWCSGPTAAEMLQISADEFFELPEDEQFMYPSSLENECFVVALVNSKRPGYGRGHCIDLEDNAVSWEITRAQNVNNAG
ncbi:unnamed protein product [Linum trigynum]|uniref:Nucleic acid-binding proteins superfamily n=1 Tax=Linum trigynum TaxID=586398 RepID=A0AAV2FGN9_9ROSI